MSYSKIEDLLDLSGRDRARMQERELAGRRPKKDELNGHTLSPAMILLLEGVMDLCPAHEDAICGVTDLKPSDNLKDLFGIEDDLNHPLMATVVPGIKEGANDSIGLLVAMNEKSVIFVAEKEKDGSRKVSQLKSQGPGSYVLETATNTDSKTWKNYLEVAGALQEIRDWQNPFEFCEQCRLKDYKERFSG